jgi:DNA-binding FadR family transcriptional regulator
MATTPAQADFTPARGPDLVLPRRRRAKFAHVLAADLRKQILSGELAADQRLPSEAGLIETLQVSRETLREALRILESESLIEIRRGRGGGAIVRRPRLDSVSRYVGLLLQVRRATLADLEEARTVVEPSLAELSVRRCGDDELQGLVARYREETEAAEDPERFEELAASFDGVVPDLCRNCSGAVFARVLRDVYHGEMVAAPGEPSAAALARLAPTVLAGHDAFLKAARRRDAGRAKEAWRKHLLASHDVLRAKNAVRRRRPINMVPMWTYASNDHEGARSQRAAMSVATDIRCRIADGRLHDGDRLLPLVDLAKHFGVSRPTLREALRILETELLVDLRPGDRGGASVRHPSSDVAAQLVARVLEARQTTVADFAHAIQMMEPAMMELAAERRGPADLSKLRRVESELEACGDDIEQFVGIWRRGVMLAVASARNPVLVTIGEMLQWVSVGIGASLVETPRGRMGYQPRERQRVQKHFSEFVAALSARRAAEARAVWAECVRPASIFDEASELGRRLMIDLIG